MRPFTPAGVRIGVLIGLVACASAAPGASTPAPSAETILVKVAPGADADDRAAISRRLGAESVRALPARWRAYRVGEDITRAEAARAVAGLPAEAVELDQPVELAAIPNDPFFSYQRHLAQIGASQAWDLVPAAMARPTTAPVIVAVIDSGLDTGHADMAGMLWSNSAERDGTPGVDDDKNGFVDDIHGANLVGGADDGDVAAVATGNTEHGTHVAGLIGAATDNGRGIAGVAPNAAILSVRFLAGGTGGGLAEAIRGIDYARRGGARVINMSWTLAPGATSRALCDAVAAAGADGIVMVAAAGNHGQDLDRTPAQPASCPSPAVLAVAATDGADDQLAAFSNVGARTVDLAAPGTEPATSIGDDIGAPGLLSLYPSPAVRPLYIRSEGTSMAAPLVAGAAALMLGARPALTPVHIGALLRSTGVPRASLVTATRSGRRLDLRAAVAASIEAVLTDARVDVVPLAPDGGPHATARPRFRWDAGAPDPIEYQVLVDGQAVAAVPGTAREATPGGPIADGMHTWSVRGVGVAAAGPERPLLVDTTPPDRVGLAATASPAGLALSWSHPADATSGVAGVRVERDGVPAADLGADSTGHTLSPGAPGVTETIAVIVADRAGNASRSEIAVTGVAPAPAPAPAAPAPAPSAGTRTIRVATTAYPRRYEVRAHAGRTPHVIARGRLAPRARTIVVRLPRGVAAATRLTVRTTRMRTTARRRVIRVRSVGHARRYTVWALDVSRRRAVARGRLAAGRATIVVRLPRTVAAVGPRLTVTIRSRP